MRPCVVFFTGKGAEPEDAVYIHEPSREKANKPDPQVWLGCYITKYHFL